MPNRLAAEKSPYLRQHADNPVAWLPWGDEALAKARAEGKPVFLSIGYSTCHWCHVMAHESFEDAGVAEILNRDFVPVKVDREERPDLDRVYMTYVQHTTGHGGWPMSVWLTPEGKPFYGGTYFPKDDRHGRPGFITLLNTIALHWQQQRPKIEHGAEEVVQALKRYASEGPPQEERAPDASKPLHEEAGEAFERGFQYFYESHDARWGGFGGAPKFPRASILDFLLRSAVLQGVDSDLGQEAIGMTATTLQRMIEGGLHDVIGGGFHRYSVDEQWHVPHFEKMLYDQALIAMNLLEAQQATGLPVFGWVARGVFDYVGRDLTSPQGGFYSAEDADSATPEPSRSDKDQRSSDKQPEHAEGAFYVWTKPELEAVLGADAEFFCAHYDVKPEGNVAHDPHGEFGGKNVLRQLRPLARTAEQFKLPVADAEQKLLACLEKLRAIRAKRPRPHLDDKILTAWNGLMISALARGAQVLGEPERLAAATRAAEFIQRELYAATSGLLYRSWREGRSSIPGFAEDYAHLIQGLLDLYEAGFELRWLQWAEQLQAKMDELFWDPELGGYFNSRADDSALIVRLKEDYDGAEPAANSVAALNLIRLDWMLGGGGEAALTRGGGSPPPSYRERALQTIEAFRPRWSRLPQALPQMLGAVELALTEPRTVVLAGDPRSPGFGAIAAVLHAKLGPRRALLCADAGSGQVWLSAKRPYLAEMKPVDGKVTAYLCENFACQAPVTDAAALRQLLGPG
ncbi:thioredoxin domain-containing protein [Oleiharenicola lentus]|uniref:Thioredoxin domain-containing protein n=1 Tax=Oleiharenicola lentus TaxID=2508720 RepID=A0A4Q1C5L1_9BACT|nr:thioredoxin domain-containing protein [Oleiharenicola lentus]RXK53730.1 thioredoxin domain-containing protein [Oleiharenicola lentus]